jgi:hypothetical protein
MAIPYCSAEDVRIKLKDIVKREIPDDIINSAIADADAYIDAHLNRYYDITGFSSSIPIIKTISKTLASSIVMGTLYQDFDQSASTWESKLWNQAINRLKQIEDNTLTIPTLSRIFV